MQEKSQIGANAIEAVLQAERQAEEDVEAAEQNAQERLRQAREKAHAIAQRTDERLATLRVRSAAQTAEVARQLESELLQHISRIERFGEQPERRQRALGRVADWLLGPEGSGRVDPAPRARGGRAEEGEDI